MIRPDSPTLGLPEERMTDDPRLEAMPQEIPQDERKSVSTISQEAALKESPPLQRAECLEIDVHATKFSAKSGGPTRLVDQSARETDGETEGLGWGTPESGEERDSRGEFLEIDEQLDPQAPEPKYVATICSYKSLAALTVRQHVKKSYDQLHVGVRSVLEMGSPPQEFKKDQAVKDERFLEQVEEHILNANEFITGSFQNSVAAWEELLGGSKRQSSKKVLKWVREGVFDPSLKAPKTLIQRG
jgi:hypothetical protein